jgi:hypothetical protein
MHAGGNQNPNDTRGHGRVEPDWAHGRGVRHHAPKVMREVNTRLLTD